MEQHRPTEICGVELAEQAAHQHHRPLQALGAVNGQDGYALPASGGGASQGIFPRLFQTLKPVQKLEQRGAAAVLHLSGQGIQGEEIVPPFSAGVHDRKQPQQVGALIDMPYQLAAGAVAHAKAQLLQLLQKPPAGQISLLRRLRQRRVKITCPPRADHGQLVSGESIDRGAQHRDQRHILPGVVHNLQQG